MPFTEIAKTLKAVDTESTASPYWLIIDPRQMMKVDVHTVASMITGPFFCREDAEKHLKGRRYAFGEKAKVYCHSGCWSWKYKEVCKKLEVGT